MSEATWTDGLKIQDDRRKGWDHSEECNCEKCHKSHDWRKNYGDPLFQCCTDTLDELIEKDEWCALSPKTHGEEKTEDGRCYYCVHPEELL